MTAAFAPLLGEHDFRSFAGKSPDTAPGAHGRCRVRRLEFTAWERGVIFHVHANRFLYHMVRNLVGTAVAVARERIEASSLPDVLAAHDRRRAGPTAPAGRAHAHRGALPGALRAARRGGGRLGRAEA